MSRFNTKTFYTVTKDGKSYFEIKKSKFFGFAVHVNSEEALRCKLNELIKLNPKARHIVRSYKIGGYGEIPELAAFDDDGEPSGTGGLPLYELISANELSDTAIFSVRYFGGVKLGRGGLARAYARSGKTALEAAEIKKFAEFIIYELELGYAELDLIKKVLDDEFYRPEVISYGETAVMQLSVLCGEESVFEERIKNITCGKVSAKRKLSRFLPLDDSGGSEHIE